MNQALSLFSRRTIAKLVPMLLLLLFAAGCGEPEPGGPGRTAGSRAGLDSAGELPPPRIEFDSVEHDFGKIETDGPVSHQFTFRNRGKSLLFIRNIKPS